MIFANVPGQEIVHSSGADLLKEKAMWITLKAGEIKDGLGMIWGVHPAYAPQEVKHVIHGQQVVTGGSALDEELPKEFFGLYRIEISSTSKRV